MWTADATMVTMTPISQSMGEFLVPLQPIVSGGWSSFDIPLTTFTDQGVSMADIIQLKFDGQGGTNPSTIYLDNIYFYQDGASGPGASAPTPTHPAADVISVYSDAYTDVADTDYNPNWGQATVVTQEMVAGDNVMLYTGLNYQGLQLGTAQDASQMTHVHLDIWTNTSSAFEVFLISSGPVEVPVAVTVPTDGWLSLDIPLTSFDPVNMSDIIQFKFVGNGDVYLDNIYFHN